MTAALAATGPVPCEVGNAEAWWPAANEDAPEAVAACAVCPAREACLAYALAAREKAGVWGGLLPLERRQMTRHNAA